MGAAEGGEGLLRGSRARRPARRGGFRLFQGAVGLCSRKPAGLSQGKQLR